MTLVSPNPRRKHKQRTFSVGYCFDLGRVKSFERIFLARVLEPAFLAGAGDSNPHYRDQNPVSCR